MDLSPVLTLYPHHTYQATCGYFKCSSMKIEILQLQNVGRKVYQTLGEITSSVTPVNGTFGFFKNNYYLVDMLIIADKRTLVMVNSPANVVGLNGIL